MENQSMGRARGTMAGLLLLLTIAAGMTMAQRPNFAFDPQNALPDITCRQTTAIAEDSTGFLWVGTEEGLFRYDGQSIYPYLHDKNKVESLPSNQVNALLMDGQGRLWVATSLGIRCYRREYDDFAPLPDHSEWNGFENFNIKVIAVDRAGKLFVALQQSVYQYDQAGSQFRKVVELEDGKINSLAFDNENNCWIGASNNGGLFCYNQQKKFITAYPDRPKQYKKPLSNEINQLAISGETIWIGTSGGGIDTYHLPTKTFSNHSFPKKLENYISSIFIAHDKKVWVCTYSCLKLYNPEKDTFYNYYNDPRNPYSVEKSLKAFYEDRAGNYWTIHSTNGVRLAKNNMKFNHIEANSGVFWATSEKITTALCYDKNKGNSRLWIGNYYNGVDIFNWKDRVTMSLKHEENNPRSIAEGTIAALFADSKKQMWVGAYPGGLQRFNEKTWDFDSFLHDPLDTFSIARNDVRAIDEDSNGHLWLAVQGEGVDRYDPLKKKFYHYNPENNNLCNAYTTDVLVDSRGNLWVATSWGLGFLPKGRKVFKNFLFKENDPATISSNEVHTVFEDLGHTIWVGTDGGLDKFDYTTHTFTRYSNGLKSKHIASILADRENNIWVSTNQGISKLNQAMGKFTNYDQNYGLLSKEFIDRSCLIDAEGTLFFGGSRGFDTFNPADLKPETRTPKVYLTDFRLFNRSISCRTDSQVIDRHISYAKNIFLDYFQNSITFHFQAIALTDAKNIEYRYKLDGFDKDWVQLGSMRAASYTNLNPGAYTFRVKAKYENGEWANDETTIGLRVAPAWWMTVWFKILLLVLLAAVVYAFVYFRTKRLQWQRQKLTELVAERTREIASKNELLSIQAATLVEKNELLNNLNATKNKLFSIISHDLRGPFNVILGFQSILVKEYAQCSEKERVEMVKKTYSTSRKVFNLVENLLNWARIQTSTIQYKPIKLDVKKTIVERLDLYRDIAEAKGINFETQLNDGLIAYADIDLLEAVLRNLIHNAIKFTTSGGKITVKADEQGHEIRISVVDTGVGMNQHQVESLFVPEKIYTNNGTGGEKGSGLGLLLCKDFVEINKGQISVLSHWGKGSSFCFTLPAYGKEDKGAEIYEKVRVQEEL